MNAVGLNSDNISNYDLEISANRKISYYFYIFFKRLFDLFFSFFAILFMIPLIIIIKIIYLINGDCEPVIFSQLRIGKNGRLFKFYKFRSMIPNADDYLKEYLKNNKEAAREYKINKKLKNDPRVTKIGRFLRNTSIDELPQMINIFKGDMSLIGNRPYLPREKEDIGEYYKDIVKTKPGLSGLWQVSGRSNLTFKDRLKLESYYSNNAGLWLDIKIFFKTFLVVLKKNGAR